MRKRKPIIAINTLAFHGYSLDTALEEIARLTDYAEPVYITKYDTALSEDYFSKKNARMLYSRLGQLRLKVMSMGSHMDLGEADSVAVFKRRMEFAKEIGAQMILTNATGKSRRMAFYKNMERLVIYTEKLDLTIGLENPGDGQDQLLGSGIEGIAVLEKLGSDRVRLNYDFCNVLTYSKGNKHPGQELEALLKYIGHLHLKNVRDQKGKWMVCGIDKGIVDYKSLFRQFPVLLSTPMSIELPLRFGFDAQFNFALHDTFTVPRLERIRKVLTDSLEYINSILS